MSATNRLLRFGVFELNLDTEELRKEGIALKLGPQPFKVLAILAGRAGQVVTREELHQAVWGEETYVDFEHGLNQCIKQIRTALNENTARPLYIETLPRKGYRFLAPVTSKTISVAPQVTPSASGIQPIPVLPGATGAASPSRTPFSPDASARASAPAEEDARLVTLPRNVALQEEAAAAEKAAPEPVRRSRRSRVIGWLSVAALAVVALVFYWHSQKANALMEKDTVVLGDVANSTGDPVFDDTLKQALRIQLDQSPLLNLVSDRKVISTLKLSGRSADDRLTPEVTRDICQRVGSKAMFTGSIAQLGSQYVVAVQALNCSSGEVLAEAQEQAKNKEDVLKAIDRAALSVRRKLGESLKSVQTFATPIQEATTPSLDALKAYSLGVKTNREKGWASAQPYFQRAIELDPNFAVAYYEMGASYNNLSEPARANQYFTKAYDLREHANERERLIISGAYFHKVTGELEKAAQSFQHLIEDYPQRYHGYQNLSVVYGSMGEYDKAVEMARQAAKLPPDRVGEYDNLVNFLLASQQLEQARSVIQEAQTKKKDSYYTHLQLYALGFFAADSSAMSEQLQWFASNASFASFGLSLMSDTEAYGGRLQKAHALSQEAVASALRSDDKEGAATWSENQALREAAVGHVAVAQAAAAAGLALAPQSLSVQAEAALAYAISGDSARAESMARDLNANYPLDTQVQSLWLPAIEAQLALNRKNPAEAIAKLQRASVPIEYGASPSILQITCLYPTYIRGQAHLATGQGSAAAAEFQKILGHSGMVWNCWTGALARLGVARANAVQASSSQGSDADAARSRASAAYQQFLTLWKDADPDIPIYQQARAESAKLH